MAPNYSITHNSHDQFWSGDGSIELRMFEDQRLHFMNIPTTPLLNYAGEYMSMWSPHAVIYRHSCSTTASQNLCHYFVYKSDLIMQQTCPLCPLFPSLIQIGTV